MPKQPIKWGLDPTIADPSSPNYNESDPDFSIAQLMLARGREMNGLAPHTIDATEGMTIQIWDIPKGVITFIRGESDLDEVTILTQSDSMVSDAQPMAIYSAINIATVNWGGPIDVESAPSSLVQSDYYSWRKFSAGNKFIRTSAP